mmetsp:Transcript_28978/g.83303  ORF Transcript_28978/g.83303 Transcript_28978/m.83303 type:complete len:238 (-) Transcript_28978:33-746(-)
MVCFICAAPLHSEAMTRSGSSPIWSMTACICGVGASPSATRPPQNSETWSCTVPAIARLCCCTVSSSRSGISPIAAMAAVSGSGHSMLQARLPALAIALLLHRPCPGKPVAVHIDAAVDSALSEAPSGSLQSPTLQRLPELLSPPSQLGMADEVLLAGPRILPAAAASPLTYACSGLKSSSDMSEFAWHGTLRLRAGVLTAAASGHSSMKVARHRSCSQAGIDMAGIISLAADRKSP